MTPQFILLPSGTYLNTSRIFTFGVRENDVTRIYFSSIEGDHFDEAIPLDDFLALLQPQQSPIVSPVVNLDNLKPGAACQFTFGGEVRHGIIDMINPEHENEFVLVSRGEKFFLDPITGRIED